MLTYRNHTICFTTLLLLTFASGCGDSDKASGARGLTAPTVLSSAPANGACPNTIVTATFSEAMNPSTIDGSDFTVVGPGGVPVAGAVTYDASSNTAIFIPEDNLAVSTHIRRPLLLEPQISLAIIWRATSPGRSPPPR